MREVRKSPAAEDVDDYLEYKRLREQRQKKTRDSVKRGPKQDQLLGIISALQDKTLHKTLEDDEISVTSGSRRSVRLGPGTPGTPVSSGTAGLGSPRQQAAMEEYFAAMPTPLDGSLGPSRSMAAILAWKADMAEVNLVSPDAYSPLSEVAPPPPPSVPQDEKPRPDCSRPEAHASSTARKERGSSHKASSAKIEPSASQSGGLSEASDSAIVPFSEWTLEQPQRSATPQRQRQASSETAASPRHPRQTDGSGSGYGSEPPYRLPHKVFVAPPGSSSTLEYGRSSWPLHPPYDANLSDALIRQQEPQGVIKPCLHAQDGSIDWEQEKQDATSSREGPSYTFQSNGGSTSQAMASTSEPATVRILMDHNRIHKLHKNIRVMREITLSRGMSKRFYEELGGILFMANRWEEEMLASNGFILSCLIALVIDLRKMRDPSLVDWTAKVSTGHLEVLQATQRSELVRRRRAALKAHRGDGTEPNASQTPSDSWLADQGRRMLLEDVS